MTLFSHRYANKIRTACGLILSALFLSGAVTVILVPQESFAAFGDAKTYVLLAPIPGTYDETSCAVGTMNTYNSNGPTTGNGAETTNCTTDFVTYLKGFFRLIISLSSIIAVLVITYEGFKLAVSTSEGARGEAKDRIQQALIGLGLVLGSYLILNTINPQLTKISFVVDKVADYTGTSAYLQDELSAALVTEQLRQENRAANEAFSAQATPILQQLEALGDCVEHPEPEECFSEQTRLENQLQQIRNSTDVIAYVNGFRNKINEEVRRRLVPPVTREEITEARRQLVLAWSTVMDRSSMLRQQGRDEEAESVLTQATKILQETTAEIDRRAARPNGDNNEYEPAGGFL